MHAHDDSYLTLPKIPLEEITPLWYDDYYDGHLSGKCLYKGTMHHYLIVAMGHFVWDVEKKQKDKEKSDPWWRRFLLIPMSPEEIQRATELQELFRKHVGTQCDYDESLPHSCQPQEEWSKYYDDPRLKDEPKWCDRPGIGWFEE